MAKLKGGRRKAEGFRCYINFYPNQSERRLKREGVITFLDKDGKPNGQRQFDYLDEISTVIREKIVEFEKPKKQEQFAKK